MGASLLVSASMRVVGIGKLRYTKGILSPDKSISQKSCSPEETTSYEWERTIHILSLPRSVMPAKIIIKKMRHRAQVLNKNIF
jgi:hypothetical protein